MAAPATAKRRPERLRLDTDERRAQLVELGLEHFGARAYDEVSIDAIATAAGISKGLLYHYFPTKRAFYAACVREAAKHLLVAALPPEEVPPLERLEYGLAAFLAYVQQRAPAYAALMRSGVGSDPEIAAIVDETRVLFVERLLEGTAAAAPLTPLKRIALRGWVGMAEAATLAWVESGEPEARVPADQVLELLRSALLSIVQVP